MLATFEHNLKKDSHCLAITTQSGKVTINPSIPIVDKVRDGVVDIDDALKSDSKKLLTSSESSQIMMSVDK